MQNSDDNRQGWKQSCFFCLAENLENLTAENMENLHGKSAIQADAMQAENPDGKSAWKNQWKISGTWKIMSSPVRSAEKSVENLEKSILSAENLQAETCGKSAWRIL